MLLPVAEEFDRFLELISINLCAIFVGVLLWKNPYKMSTDHAFALVSLLLLIPPLQCSMLDPLGQTIDIPLVVDIVVVSEFVLFFAFLGARPIWNLSKRCHCIHKKEENHATSRVGGDPGSHTESVRLMAAATTLPGEILLHQTLDIGGEYEEEPSHVTPQTHQVSST